MKTRKIFKRIAAGLLATLVVIQFFHPAKNISTATSANDIERLYPLSDSVHNVLQRACYDCHSNNTKYPWYFNIQPVAWWMAHHVEDGKEELNFSEFGKYTLAKRAKKLKKSAREVEEGEMPLDSYTWIHKEAVLSASEKQMIIAWAKQLSQQISEQKP